MMEEKTFCTLQMLDFETSAEVSNSIKIPEWEITSPSKNNFTSEGVVSHNVLHYQQLYILLVTK